MQIMLSIYLNSSTCKYLSLDNGVTMTSKGRENINLVSFICLSFLVISFSKQLNILWFPYSFLVFKDYLYSSFDAFLWLFFANMFSHER